jgi:protein-disulfide isomerase
MKKRRENHTGLYIFLAIVLIIGGIIVYKQASRPRYDDPKPPRAFKGVEDAPVVITEFSDFECPACRSAFPLIKALVREKGGLVRFDYRNFPLISIHQFAFHAAEAFECANDQDKAWDMHDMLFENQPRLNQSDIEQMGKNLNLDMEKFNACLGSRAKAGIVNDDLKEGRKRGVDSTPTFYINDQKINNWQLLGTEIELELKKLGANAQTPKDGSTDTP